jgi:hypothetical protein
MSFPHILSSARLHRASHLAVLFRTSETGIQPINTLQQDGWKDQIAGFYREVNLR